MKNIQKLDKQQASSIIGGYREYASKAGCESREGVGNCFLSKTKKDNKWRNSGGVFTQ